MANCLVTTIDNPFSPADDFKRWWMFDVEHHYKTCETLAHYANSIKENSEEELNEEELNELAIDRMIELDFENKWKKIYIE